ncbi:MAG: hypothetical protein M3Q68_01600 [Actinomycetota bacterium]|nr:hypothetical protein [Actinomycetota bacterium]
MPKTFTRIALGIVLALALGSGACGGGNADDENVPAEDAGSGDQAPDNQASDDTGDAPKDDADKAEIPKEVCDILSAEEVSAVVGTVTSKPGPQGSCTYDGEAREGLFPTIYLKDASDFVIKGIGQPFEIDGNPGYVSAVADSAQVQHGVLIVDGIYIDVVVNSTDLAAATPKIKELLTLTASKL